MIKKEFKIADKRVNSIVAIIGIMSIRTLLLSLPILFLLSYTLVPLCDQLLLPLTAPVTYNGLLAVPFSTSLPSDKVNLCAASLSQTVSNTKKAKKTKTRFNTISRRGLKSFD